jgi:hypothetical protein
MLQFHKSQPTPGDVYVNQALTQILVAEMQSRRGFIADQVFPNIPVDNQSDVYQRILRGGFNRNEMRKRAPGTPSAQLGYGMTTDSFYCDVVAGHVPVEDQSAANERGAVDLRRQATELCSQQALIYREVAWMASFFTTSIWGTDATTPTNKWNATNGDPITDIETGIDTIVQKTGIEPNTLVLSRLAWKGLKNNPLIVDRIRGQGSPSSPAVVTREAVASIFELERILVSSSIVNSGKEGQTDSHDFIAGKHALVCYVAPNPGIMIPSAGYTFGWRRMGTSGPGGQRMKVFRDEKVESTIHEMQQAFAQKVVCADVGYFIPTVVT